MAKYATTEELYQCYRCHITCTERDLRPSHFTWWILVCPNCTYPSFMIIGERGIISAEHGYY